MSDSTDHVSNHRALVRRLHRRVRRLHQRARPAFVRFLNVFRGTVLTVEGGIGIGKSTKCRSLVQVLNEAGVPATYMPEDYDPQLLEAFLDQAKAAPGEFNAHAAPFQFDVQTRRIATYRQALALQQAGQCVVIDRSLVGDYAFAMLQYEDGNLTEADWDEYCRRAEAADLLDPDLTLFLHASPQVALERCQKRARTGEDAYTLDYFRRLSRVYLACFEAVDYPCLYVDWSVTREIDPETGMLDRDVVLDVLAHAHTQLAPPPTFPLHVNHHHLRASTGGVNDNVYERYGYTTKRSDLTTVRFAIDDLPQTPDETAYFLTHRERDHVMTQYRVQLVPKSE